MILPRLERPFSREIRAEKQGLDWRSPHIPHLMQSDLYNKLSVGVSDLIDHSALCVWVGVLFRGETVTHKYHK